MIVGIGVDRIAIARVANTYARFQHQFVARIFTPLEFEQANERSTITRRLAMFFAAKEAVAKALGTGFSQGVAPKMIETRYLSSGQPTIILHGMAAEIATRKGIAHIHISLTDDEGIAQAFAVAEATCACK
ncbi:MAG: holo-ACP synthase [Zetaproteobacteria bacterium]|nr:holo-ACP synthase [Zetaproteobacteria bacterium]